MILEKVPPALKGELSCWLIEVKSGVYIGQVSARVRDQLWEHCKKGKKSGGVFQAWTSNNEQGYHMRMHGIEDRRIVDWEGIELIQEVTEGVNEVQKARMLAG